MRCPTCDVNLIDGDRPDVTSGYCPECEGEWFARGAVDVLIDRAARSHNGREPRHDAPAATERRDGA